jgi:hypothetical protein
MTQKEINLQMLNLIDRIAQSAFVSKIDLIDIENKTENMRAIINYNLELQEGSDDK